MTSNDDSLNAFLGVLHYFEGQQSHVCHLWGVPFIVHETLAQHYREEVDAYITDALCWQHVHSCWESAGLRPTRRSKFPSWSWAGWAGGIEHNREPHTHQMSPFGSLLTAVRVEYDDGHLTRLDDLLLNSWAHQRYSYPKALWVDALVLPASAANFRPSVEGDSQQNDQWTVFGFPAFLNLSQGPSSLKDFLCIGQAGVSRPAYRGGQPDRIETQGDFVYFGRRWRIW